MIYLVIAFTSLPGVSIKKSLIEKENCVTTQWNNELIEKKILGYFLQY
jgi:hypothetical protein